MASPHQILCIRKNPRADIHKRIERIGGINADQTRWSLTLDDAIAGIETGKWQFYVITNGYRADVIVATSASVHKYLKTTRDSTSVDNLLSLPECP